MWVTCNFTKSLFVSILYLLCRNYQWICKHKRSTRVILNFEASAIFNKRVIHIWNVCVFKCTEHTYKGGGVNKRNHQASARGKRQWKVDRDWSKVIFSEECTVVIAENNCVYVWRKPGEERRPECLSPGCVPKLSVKIWGFISWYGVGTISIVKGNINAQA